MDLHGLLELLFLSELRSMIGRKLDAPKKLRIIRFFLVFFFSNII
jgi:hypothetical protein